MRTSLCAAILVLSPTLLIAAEPFTLTATGGGTTITASGKNVVDLAGDLIDLALPHWSTGDLRAGCVGYSNQSADGCTWEVNMECPADRTPYLDTLCQQFGQCDPPPLFTLRSSTKWIPGLTVAAATVSSSLSGTGTDCSSLYAAALVRQ